jgi:vacuolar-type H+-ATPase subunit I/STV1
VKRISVENAQPGQILAQKIQRGDGVLLAGPGAEVSENLLRMLNKLNIETIVIEEENKLSPEELEEVFQKRRAEVSARFERVDSLPLMAAFKKALLDQALRARDEALAALIPEVPEEPPGAPKEA